MTTTIGERIKTLRTDMNLSQRTLANHIGIKQNSIAVIETNKRNPSHQTILSLVRFFHVREEWLVNGTGDKNDADYGEILRQAEIAKLSYNDITFILSYIKLSEANRKKLREGLAALADSMRQKDNK